MANLKEKVAIITGCAGERGFGRAIARKFAVNGANLVLLDVANPSRNVAWRGLDAVAEETRALGVQAITFTVNVTNSAEIKAAVDQALAKFGRIDILVNNAAAPPGPDRAALDEVTDAAWSVVLDTNLKGAFLCTRAAASAMARRRTGRVINMSSSLAKTGAANMAAYCASKAGLIGLTRALAIELAPAQITVNAICPGFAETDRLDHVSLDPDVRAEFMNKRKHAIPLGRVATPEDVADLAAYLATDGASYITGQTINLAGGAVMS